MLIDAIGTVAMCAVLLAAITAVTDAVLLRHEQLGTELPAATLVVLPLIVRASPYLGLAVFGAIGLEVLGAARLKDWSMAHALSRRLSIYRVIVLTWVGLAAWAAALPHVRL